MTDPADQTPLEDGVYDVFVIDALHHEGRVTSVTVTITAGVQRGAIVDIGVTGWEISDIEVMGLPGTLTVDRGAPHLQLEP